MNRFNRFFATPHAKFLSSLALLMFLAVTTAVGVSLVQTPTVIPRAQQACTDRLSLNDCRVETDLTQVTGKLLYARLKVCNTTSNRLLGIKLYLHSFYPPPAGQLPEDGQVIAEAIETILGSEYDLSAGECNPDAWVHVTLTPRAKEMWDAGTLGDFSFMVGSSASMGAQGGRIKVKVHPRQSICGDGVKQQNEVCDPNHEGTKTSCIDNRFKVNCKNDCSGYETPGVGKGICSVDCWPTANPPPGWSAACKDKGINATCSLTGGGTGWCTQECSCCPDRPPEAPSNLTASEEGTGHEVRLSWSDVTCSNGSKIERANGQGAGITFSQIASVGGNVTTYLDPDLTSGSTYSYRIRAFNNSGDSVYTGPVSITLGGGVSIPAAPGGFLATPYSFSEIDLSWQDNSNNEQGFKLYRKTDDMTTWPAALIVTTQANVTTYRDTGLTAVTTYNYKLLAYNAVGESAAVMFSATTHALTCGDGTCGTDETPASCPADCVFSITLEPEATIPVGESLKITGTNVPAGAATAEVVDFVPNTGATQNWGPKTWQTATSKYFSFIVPSCTGGLTGSVPGSVRVETSDQTADWLNFTLDCGSVGGPTCSDAPVAPTDLSAVEEGSDHTKVKLTWANVDCEDGYKISRKLGSGSWTQVGDALPDTLTYTDTGLTPGSTYSYKVQAHNTHGANDSDMVTIILATEGKFSGLITVTNLQAGLKEIRIYYQEADTTGDPPFYRLPLGNTPESINQRYEIPEVFPASRKYNLRAELDFVYTSEPTTNLMFCDLGGSTCGGTWRYKDASPPKNDAHFNFTVPGRVGRISGEVTVHNPSPKTLAKVEVEVQNQDGALFTYDVPTSQQTARGLVIPYEIPITLSPGDYTIQARVGGPTGTNLCGPLVNCCKPNNCGWDPIGILPNQGTRWSPDPIIIPADENQIGVILAVQNLPEYLINLVNLKYWRTGEPTNATTVSMGNPTGDNLTTHTVTYETILDVSGSPLNTTTYDLEVILEYQKPDDTHGSLTTSTTAVAKGTNWSPSLVIPAKAGTQLVAAKFSISNNASGWIKGAGLIVQEKENAIGDWAELPCWSNGFREVSATNNPQNIWLEISNCQDREPLLPDKTYRLRGSVWGFGEETGGFFLIQPDQVSPDFTVSSLPFIFGDDEEGFVWNLRYVSHADVNGDGQVDILDYSYLVTGANCWTASFDPRADVNGNGACNVADVEAFVMAWTILSHY